MRRLDDLAAETLHLPHRLAQPTVGIQVDENAGVGADLARIRHETASIALVVLEHGKPIVFSGGRKGLTVRNMEPVVVDAAANPADLLVHNAKSTSPALAALLAELEPPQFPTAIGIFRDVERPTYDQLLMDQIKAATGKKGRGDLQSLLNAGTTWQVD